MTKQIELLKQLGLDSREAKVYLAALEFGPATVVTLAKKTGVKRTTIYEFLDDMIARGLIVTSVSGKRPLYSACEPSRLGEMVERQKEAIAILLPELDLIAQKSPKRPRVRFYEGREGLQQVYMEPLNQPRGSIVKAYVPDFGAVYEALSPTFFKKYLDTRLRRGVIGHAILPSGEDNQVRIDNNEAELRESIVVPKEKFPISNEINIYQNKVAIMSLGDEQIGVIIESQQIADTQRAIFDLLWDSLKELERKGQKSIKTLK